MTASPKISIVTPSYNQGKYIEQTILSIINNGYSNYELIVIDGGSTDETIDIIKKYESHIAYWVSEKDNGQAHAINKGISNSTGDIFNWINSDDYLEPGSLQLIAEYFSANSSKNILCGFTRCFYDEDNSTSHTYRMRVSTSATDTLLNVEMNQPGTFYRLPIIKQLNGVNESLRYIFDNELWFRYLAKYGIDGIGISERLFAQFRLHNASKSVFEGYKLFNAEANDIWKFLSTQLNLDSVLIDSMSEMECANRYRSSVWDISNINKKEVELFFADRFMVSLIQKGRYGLARQAWLYRYKKNKAVFNRMNLSSFVRLFLFPGFLKS